MTEIEVGERYIFKSETTEHSWDGTVVKVTDMLLNINGRNMYVATSDVNPCMALVHAEELSSIGE